MRQEKAGKVFSTSPLECIFIEKAICNLITTTKIWTTSNKFLLTMRYSTNTICISSSLRLKLHSFLWWKKQTDKENSTKKNKRNIACVEKIILYHFTRYVRIPLRKQKDFRIFKKQFFEAEENCLRNFKHNVKIKSLKLSFLRL